MEEPVYYDNDVPVFCILATDEECKSLINAINGCSLDDKQKLQEVLKQLKGFIE